MFKLRSIAARLILAISLTVAVACAILGTFSIIQQRALTRLALEQQLKLQYDSVMAAIDYEGRAKSAPYLINPASLGSVRLISGMQMISSSPANSASIYGT
jgi:hypothetical protein